jgi:DNA-binding LacI/PurR family transcriptional regulator
VATIADVAREAGVGIGTVSRVLNDSPLVSEATRARVLAVMERLGYQPSPIARAFGARRTHTLELVVSLFTRGHFVDILRGVEQALIDTVFRLLVRTVENETERERVFDECCGGGQSDGVLIVGMLPTDGLVARLAREGVPAVLVNVVDSRVWSVSVDHDLAAAEAVAYCLGLGHRRIALLDRAEDPLDSAGPGLCQRGYRKALAEAGVSVPHAYEQRDSLSIASGAAALEAFVQLSQPPTAIVAASEVQAIGMLEAARRLGRAVPDEVSVVGYNDSEMAAYLGLTTMRVPLRELGRRATEVLLAALAEPEGVPRTSYLASELVRRRTCGVPRLSQRESVL